MKLVKLSFLVVAALAAQACGADGLPGVDGKDGADGKAGEAQSTGGALSLVTPNTGVLDREVEVSIGGNGTTFADGVKPSFGPGIEVLESTTSTTSLLIAKIRISKDAPLGPRTIQVGDIEAKDAFTVIPAINVLAAGGKATIEQGGLLQFTIENNDAHAFDPNNFQLNAGEFIDLGTSVSGPQSATAFVLAAPLAKVGPSQISVANLDSSGNPRTSFLSANDALTVKTRAPDPFKLDAPTDAAFKSPTDTKFFKLSSAANEAALVDYRIEIAADSTAIPLAFVFGTGGGKDDRLGYALPGQNPFTGEYNPPPYDLHVALPISAGAAATDHYVILANLNGSAATAKVTATRSAAIATNESSSAHDTNAPQVVGAVSSSAGVVLNANLAAADEVDAYAFTVEADAKLQFSAVSDAELEIVLTKDPTVLVDPQNTPPASRNVLGNVYPWKQSAAQLTLAAGVGATTVYAVVVSDSQGVVKTGKYTLGVRNVP